MKNKSKGKITLDSEKVKKREQRIKILKITILLILLFLIILYFILRVVYELGDFTVSLDPQLEEKSGLVMYEHLADKQHKRILKAEKLEYMDNICVKWLPDNLSEGEGSHNGDNYLAYSFYLENQGVDPINYWYTIISDDVIKNVDRAIRIMVIRNDEQIIYAKANETTGEAEIFGDEITTPFYSNTNLILCLEQELVYGEEINLSYENLAFISAGNEVAGRRGSLNTPIFFLRPRSVQTGIPLAWGVNTDGRCDTNGLEEIVAVAAGDDFTIYLKKDGTVVNKGTDDYNSVTNWSDIVSR